MGIIEIASKERVTNIIIEDSAYEGVKEIGKTVAEDICLVTGKMPQIIGSFDASTEETSEKCIEDNLKETSEKASNGALEESVVFVATVGKSALLEKMSEGGLIGLKQVEGKREVFMMKILDITNEECRASLAKKGIIPADSNLKSILVIAGSDKRGTIYGMFHLSELCGVSPLVYFGDAMPEKKDELSVSIEKRTSCACVGSAEMGGKSDIDESSEDDTYISKEPSVYYRGFFINDEWPAFGNWATEKFGDVNAKCYRKIFELLLRMKGNYMWPAMWNSNFSEDGPGVENARLADELGVIMGTSHHEPLFRAGNEWQQQYRNYGEDNSWSFMSNGEAITKFWEDGVKRNKDFESVITIGMRGEADSKLLPEDATMKDNIEVVKKAILAQDKILFEQFKDGNNIYCTGKEGGSEYQNVLRDIPRMLAIYKEVEDYYYGDETCEGLKDWDELKDVIFLLSDDNHGNLRNIPTEEERKHPGGFGMYYHFDYHGAPISYEWVNCNRLTKTWEQMTTAYEAGVKKMWIVNVGDLKEMEYPLSFFMDLAYDYETWGANGLNKVREYVYNWIDKQFADNATKVQKDMIAKVLEGYTRLNALRTPETMNEMIYHPVHFGEAERILGEARAILEIADALKNDLSKEALFAYESMIYYPAAASLNMIIAWILTGFNHDLARKGAVYANSFIPEIEERIALDQKLVSDFHKFNNGKWNHMMASAHTGFRSWDDREWSYPIACKVAPLSVAKAMVSFAGQDRYHLGAYWQDMAPLVNDDFTRPGVREVLLNIDTRGSVPFEYKITLEGDALKCSEGGGRIDITCGRNDNGAAESNAISNDIEKYGRSTIAFLVVDELFEGDVKGRVDISFDNGQKTYVDLLFKVASKEKREVECHVIGGERSYVVIKAEDFAENHKIDDNGREVVAGFGECECSECYDGAVGFEVVEFLGREDSAIKVFPAMKKYEIANNDNYSDVPYVAYNIDAAEAGEYDVIFHLMTRNPSFKGGRLTFYVASNDSAAQPVHSVSEHYYTEWQDEDWAQGVLRGGRTVSARLALTEGKNTIKVFAGEPGVIIEKLIVKKKDYKLPESYLGPCAD